MSDRDRAARLEELRDETRLGGGEARIARQHEKGKLTARERLELLLDPGSFEELGTFVRHRSRDFGLESNRPAGDGVVTGFGTVDGRLTYVFSQDFTVFGGSLSETNAEKIVRVMKLAMENGALITQEVQQQRQERTLSAMKSAPIPDKRFLADICVLFFVFERSWTALAVVR